MGTGSSFLRGGNKDAEDDVMGTGNGVVKTIPNEVPPTRRQNIRRFGLHAGTSFWKKNNEKSSSLRSALSVDLENPEVEKIRKEFEMYRRNKENEIANYEKKDRKLNTETRKLKAELHAQQKTCQNIRRERDLAREAEHQALVRAAAFESERDKIQRQFKLFRETKENEIQTLLRARRDLENKLAKVSHGIPLEEGDNGSRIGLEMALGSANPGDWWTALESEPSLGSTTQLHMSSTLKGPEFAQGMLELDGPFTNVNKEDWNAAAASLQEIMPTIPDMLLTNTITIYVCAAKDAQQEVNMLYTKYEKKLRDLCVHEGRFMNLCYMPGENVNSMCVETHMDSRRKRVESSNVFIGFFYQSIHQFTELELNWGHMHNPGNKHVIFCFRDRKNLKRQQTDADVLKKCLVDSGSIKLIDKYSSPESGVDQAYVELDKILRSELGVETKDSDHAGSLLEQEGPELLCGGCLWDPKHDYEQLEALCNARRSTCELKFEKYYEQLNAHVSAPGPLPPLLITGSSGCGRSLLLAKWIELQQQRSSGNLVLYHFVGHSSSRSACPIVMIRRITEKLMHHVTNPPPLTCDPVRLVEEFPRWLEKVSSKLPGGVVLVLDSIHSFQQGETQLKWLLDPLPVDSRIIVSVNENSCPQTWQSWPTLRIEDLSNKSVKELLRAELASHGRSLNEEQESRILTHCRSPQTTVPLYVVVLASELAKCPADVIDRRLDKLLDTSNTVKLYCAMLELVRHNYEHGTANRGLMKKVLQLIYVSRNGLCESELFAVVPSLTWNFWAPMCDALVDRHIIVIRSGVLVFRHDEVREAVKEKLFSNGDEKQINSTMKTLRDYFAQFQYPNEVTYRGAEELPWLNSQLDDKEGLHQAILNLCVFVKLYGMARCNEIINYWQQIGEDKHSMAKMYNGALKQMEQMVGHFDGTVTLPRIADVYEALGRFLRDLNLLVEALAPLQRALEIRETALDPDHPSVAQTLHQVAGLHAQQGSFSTAEALYNQAREIYEEAFGSDHYLVAKELDALAVLYQKQGKHELAEPLHRKAVSIRRKSKAPRVSSGRVRTVDPLKRRVLQLEELAMGPDSPDLARTLNELGVLYYLQNNVDTAESFFKRSLEMREAVLPCDHPDLAQSLNNLAALYHDRKQFDKAEPLYERALQLRLKVYGPDHQSVASVINHLAMLYKKMGKHEKAEPLYKQAIEIRQRAFGDQHPSVATAMVNLAVLYSQQSNHTAALPLYEKALTIYEESLGPNHPRVAETLKNLALLKYEQGDYETAASLYKRSTEIKESTTVSGQVTPRRSSTYDPPHLKSMAPPPTMFYTQRNYPPCSTANVIRENIQSQQDKACQDHPPYTRPVLTVTIVHVLQSPRLTRLRLP